MKSEILTLKSRAGIGVKRLMWIIQRASGSWPSLDPTKNNLESSTKVRWYIPVQAEPSLQQRPPAWHRMSALVDVDRCVCSPGGSDNGRVEASVARNGHRQRNDPSSPPKHLIGKCLGKVVTVKIHLWTTFLSSTSSYKTHAMLISYGTIKFLWFEVVFLH